MLSTFKSLIQSLKTPEPSTPISMDLAIASLLCQIAQADEVLDEREQQVQQQLLAKLTNIDQEKASELLEQAQVQSQQATSVFEFTDALRSLKQEQRFELICSMWQVAYADQHLDPLEEAIIRKVAELLYVNHQDFIRAKLKVTGL